MGDGEGRRRLAVTKRMEVELELSFLPPKIPILTTQSHHNNHTRDDHSLDPTMEASSSTRKPPPPVPAEILYRPYTNEDEDLPHIQRLVESELSEPYTVSPQPSPTGGPDNQRG